MIIIYSTTRDAKEARIIASTLVKEGLCACVNFFPVNSMYRWEGKVQEDAEVALFIKTRQELYSRVERRIKELHSYSVPCILRLKVEDGEENYLKWVEDETVER